MRRGTRRPTSSSSATPSRWRSVLGEQITALQEELGETQRRLGSLEGHLDGLHAEAAEFDGQLTVIQWQAADLEIILDARLDVAAVPVPATKEELDGIAARVIGLDREGFIEEGHDLLAKFAESAAMSSVVQLADRLSPERRTLALDLLDLVAKAHSAEDVARSLAGLTASGDAGSRWTDMPRAGAIINIDGYQSGQTSTRLHWIQLGLVQGLARMQDDAKVLRTIGALIDKRREVIAAVLLKNALEHARDPKKLEDAVRERYPRIASRP